jgi:hypothetical protein
MNRLEKRRHMRLLKKQAAHQMGLPRTIPTVGFGITLTNKRIAVLIWNRAYTLWARR